MQTIKTKSLLLLHLRVELLDPVPVVVRLQVGPPLRMIHRILLIFVNNTSQISAGNCRGSLNNTKSPPNQRQSLSRLPCTLSGTDPTHEHWPEGHLYV